MPRRGANHGSGDTGAPATDSAPIRTGARRLTMVGYWTTRILLGFVVLLYGLSFVGPPPVERRAIDYDRPPAAVAADAVHNLRAETYRYTVRATERDESGRGPVFAATVTVDNRARHYVARVRTTETGFGADDVPRRHYGTVTAHYERYPATSSYIYAGQWHRGGGLTFTINAFSHVERLRAAPARVVADNESWYVVRLDTGALESDVAYPGPVDPAEDGRPNSLALGVRKSTDRVAWARYRAEGDDGELVATYRFHRGLAVDVDRPIETYPPGTEVVSRLNLGIGALEALLLGGRGG